MSTQPKKKEIRMVLLRDIYLTTTLTRDLSKRYTCYRYITVPCMAHLDKTTTFITSTEKYTFLRSKLKTEVLKIKILARRARSAWRELMTNIEHSPKNGVGVYRCEHV